MHRRLALLLLIASACKSRPEPTPVPEGSGSAKTVATPPAKTTGLELAAIDRAVKPGDDFDAYANGMWNRTIEIPADRSSIGAFELTGEVTGTRNAGLLKDAAANAPAGSEARKVGDYYASFMDEAAIEAKGLAPLQPTLDAIAKIADPKALASALGDTIRADVDAINSTNFATPNIFGLWIAQDFAEPTTYSPFLVQGGLGLPDREFYEKPSVIRDKYIVHIASMLTLANIPDADAKAKEIMRLEMRIASVHSTRKESADVHRGLTRWTRTQFAERAPGLDWDAVFAACGLGSQPSFVVWHPVAMTGIAAAVKAEPLATWKDYLTYHAIERAAAFLPKAFVDEQFAFWDTTVAGTPTQRERWKRAVDATSDALGDAVGKLYVAKYFPATEKARAQAMVANILAAFAKRVDGLSWMSPETKAKAKAKLAVMKIGLGYPDTWRSYAGLEIVKGDALGNADRAARFELARNLAKLGKPVDRGEWMMVAHLVNAVNLPAMNAMNFPAAILQPPFFDPGRPEVMNYGAIGAVIGHEISHSFDDQGALFDASGKLENWWTKDDFAHFAESGAALAKQYDQYKPFPDVAVSGTLVLSENIADVAGVSAAYDAYKATLPNAPAWEGLAGDQQFFLAFAQMWRLKAREAALRANLVTDVHAPPPFRSATVRNLDAWYAAFDVKPGEARYLAPAERVRVW